MMTLMEAIENRHAVRKYVNKEIDQNIVLELRNEINKCNMKEKLSIQLIANDQSAFKGLMAHYGGFRNVSNYIALVGEKNDTIVEKLGFYGEHLVLKAQQLGLNTCWVAVTYKKGKCKAMIKENEALICIIALGYGETQGVPHKSKDISALCNYTGTMPIWFEKGMWAASLAPTAQNKQNFKIILDKDEVKYEVKKSKFSNIDLGIIKYHFQVGAELIDKMAKI